MNCEDLRPWLNAYFDGELDLPRTLEIETHLEGCPDCGRQLEAMRTLGGAVRQPTLRYAAPTALRAQILAALPPEAVTEAVPAPPAVAAKPAVMSATVPVRRRPLFAVFRWPEFVMGAVCASLAITVWMNQNMPRFVEPDRLYAPLPPEPFGDATDLANDVVASHVRSLMANHLEDVISTDHHTVKPWFDGKIDFAPPVHDLAAAGFPLAGGRLDYLDGRPVAALVYRHGKHFINLFIWPVGAGDATAESTGSIRGYNVVHWTAGGDNFWAVSDTAVEELDAFTIQLRALN